MQSSTINAGAISRPVALAGGDYVTQLYINPGTRDGGFTGAVTISVEETTAEGLTQTIAQMPLIGTWGAVGLQEVKYTLRPGSTVRVRVVSPNAGPWRFILGPLIHNRVGGYLNNLNRGKHVLLGDSWFTSGGDFHNRLIARLNKATVVSAGVPGNRASQLIARFQTDVVPQNPDFVWVMVGTNDYYADVSNADFEQQILQLRSMIQQIGAQPIFFNATVGAISYVPEQLTKSRSYALNVRYVPQQLAPNGAGSVRRNFTYSGSVTVAAGATTVLAVSPGQTRLPALLRFLTQSLAGMTLKLEYSSSADGAGAVDLATFTGTGVTNDFPLARTDTALRFVKLSVTNGTGSPITAWVLADICWQQSLV
ncbi:GDSL-like Lipase/Acylhydrolase [Pseudomonas sp. GM84]|uniref:SGNH/GDSL hydrolase family protein n=1 Tax=Pseudomonas sp. GM84 TaxID=1144340 RepID=UPI00026F82C4|nr:GDSL-type esterase/lipase family protein [Pseudomonas sp. GM84]EJN32123.1 GDSL-like Lipase/Acylhydrolase [Pseudomonas sp. GM84]